MKKYSKVMVKDPEKFSKIGSGALAGYRNQIGEVIIFDDHEWNKDYASCTVRFPDGRELFFHESELKEVYPTT